MDQSLPGVPDYKTLSENGLKLSQVDFHAIVSAVTQGVKEARKYLHTENDSPPPLTISNEAGAIGYSYQSDAINIRMDYLNLIAANTTPLAYRDQLICFVPDTFYMILKHLSWMRLFGIEETTHYYQRHGNPHLSVKFPEAFPETLSPKSLLLSDLEVEARTMVDKIIIANNEQPVWKNVDAYLLSHYPKYYNKPIDYLSMLPKPDLPISFEMENLII